MSKPNKKDIVPAEQKRYATFLKFGAWSGIALLVISYTIYLMGLLDPYVPFKQLQEYWALQSGKYVEKANLPANWGWVSLIDHADFLNFIGIALLGLLTIVGLLTLIPTYIKKKNWCYLVIVCLQVIVLAISASGLLTGV